MGWLKIRENIQHEKVGETKFGASKENHIKKSNKTKK